MYSLREIGRRLDIPPSSIAYYKDRFARFVPVAGGQGRRVKYSEEALIIFKEIREMFNSNWTAEQVEEQLESMRVTSGMRGETAASVSCGYVASPVASKVLGATGGVSRGEYAGGGDAGLMRESGAGNSGRLVQDIAAVLDKMSIVLEAQARFQDEIASLKGEVEQLREEKNAMVAAYEQRIRQMDEELASFRRERKALLEQFSAADPHGGKSAKSAEQHRPSDTVMEQPLVVLKGGEFLGVSSKDKAFSLNTLVGLMERNSMSRRDTVLRWQYQHQGGKDASPLWTLSFVTDAEGQGKSEYVMEISTTKTPRGNQVTCLERMFVNAEKVPDSFVLMLFKNVKESLEK